MVQMFDGSGVRHTASSRHRQCTVLSLVHTWQPARGVMHVSAPCHFFRTTRSRSRRWYHGVRGITRSGHLHAPPEPYPSPELEPPDRGIERVQPPAQTRRSPGADVAVPRWQMCCITKECTETGNQLQEGGKPLTMSTSSLGRTPTGTSSPANT